MGNIAVGDRVTTSGLGAVSVGGMSSATGAGSIALGMSATANGGDAIAIGGFRDFVDANDNGIADANEDSDPTNDVRATMANGPSTTVVGGQAVAEWSGRDCLWLAIGCFGRACNGHRTSRHGDRNPLDILG